MHLILSGELPALGIIIETGFFKFPNMVDFASFMLNSPAFV